MADAPQSATSSQQHYGKHSWTRSENEELLFCYYSSHPSERGYRKHLTNLWTQRNSTLKFNEQHLCGQALSLLKRKYFSDIEL